MSHNGAYAQKALNHSLFLNLKMNNTTFAVIAIVSALALLGVVAVTVASITLQQEAEARGCSATSPAANASKLRCIRP